MKIRIIIYTFFLLLVSGVFIIIKNPIFSVEKNLPEEWQLANAAAMKRHVEFFVGIHPPRNYKNPESLKLAADYIYQRFFEAELDIQWQTFEVSGKKYYNVIAQVGPKEGEPIVIGAHYDVAHDLPGADDNASGTAGLLEVARLLSQVKDELKRPVILIAFSLEEPPYFGSNDMGSVVHAESLVKAGTKIKLMISLEMIGFYLESENSQDYPSPLLKLMYPSVGNFIALIARPSEFFVLRKAKELFIGVTDIPTQSANVPTFVPGVDYSDHSSYWNRGFPAMMVTDTAFMRNKNYHTPGDVPEILDYNKMADVVNGVAAIAKGL